MARTLASRPSITSKGPVVEPVTCAAAALGLVPINRPKVAVREGRTAPVTEDPAAAAGAPRYPIAGTCGSNGVAEGFTSAGSKDPL